MNFNKLIENWDNLSQEQVSKIDEASGIGKSTNQMVEAFQQLQNKKLGKKQVMFDPSTKIVTVAYDGNKVLIADIKENTLNIDFCGYRTDTTKGYLNQFLGIFGYSINQKKGKWYLNFDSTDPITKKTISVLIEKDTLSLEIPELKEYFYNYEG